MTTDILHAVALCCGFAATAGGAFLAWGAGYALLLSGLILMASVLRARSIKPESGAQE